MDLCVCPGVIYYAGLCNGRCGSGLSGQALSEAGHSWVGLDISRSMLGKVVTDDVMNLRETVCGCVHWWQLWHGRGKWMVTSSCGIWVRAWDSVREPLMEQSASPRYNGSATPTEGTITLQSASIASSPLFMLAWYIKGGKYLNYLLLLFVESWS